MAGTFSLYGDNFGVNMSMEIELLKARMYKRFIFNEIRVRGEKMCKLPG